MFKSFMKFWSKKASDGKKENQKRKAFTLVEILIVVAVIGILFVALVPRIDFAGDKARETGVKTDFRAFELAAEQILRENAGLSGISTTAVLCGADGINMYLDRAMYFDGPSGECAKKDQWNQAYTIQLAKPSTGNPNNGAIMFISNGKDSLIDETVDNYALVVAYIDGRIETKTIGFSSNIENDYIDFGPGSEESFSFDASTGEATIGYKSEI